MDKFTDIVGYTGGGILAICLIPQIYEIIKTKHVENISYWWQFMYFTGILSHLYYSIYYDLLPIYIPSIVELLLIICLIGLKIKYQKNKIIGENIGCGNSEGEKDEKLEL